MRIGFEGELQNDLEIRAGFIGCGSHSFRNLYPVFQYTPVNLVSTCDLNADKAAAFAAKFGAHASYTDYHEMLARENLDAVFICTGYDALGRPLYPQIAIDCLRAGVHVWIEKPPASSTSQIDKIREASRATGKQVAVGFKKMFLPSNEKAAELMRDDSFGSPQLVTLTYPQYIPTVEQFARYLGGQNEFRTRGFLDHICHPASLLVFLLGMPLTLYYERSSEGAGIALFSFASGTSASIIMTSGASHNGGMERTLIVGSKGMHIVVENNIRLTLHRNPPVGRYGAAPNYFAGGLDQTSATWEPEFSLGQLYNKGMFMLGYYGEINEFARAILEKRPVAKGTLDQAFHVTRLFEAFAEGPAKVIAL
jgi:predicted dehydrogenase